LPASQEGLQEDEIEPAFEFPADLPKLSDLLEPELVVQPQACLVGCVDRRHYRVIAALLRDRDQRPEQLLPKPAAAAAGSDVNGVLDGVLIGRPRTERTVTRETEDAPCRPASR